MPRFDIPIKRLVERRAADWVRFIYPEARPDSVRSMAKELTPKAQSRLDEVFAVTTPAGEAIVHFEIQGYHDPAFPARMLRYQADIWELYYDRRPRYAAGTSGSGVLFSGA